MTADLPLMARVITPLAKSILMPLGLPAAMPATDTAIQKKLWIRNYSINNFKWKNGRYNEHTKTTWRMRITNKRN